MTCPRCRQDTPPRARLCPKCRASLRPSARRPGPTGTGPNLNAIAKTAARLCDAHDALIFLADGATLRLAAQHGSTRTTRQLGEPFPMSRREVFGRAVLERRVIHVRDLKAAVRTQYPGLEPRQRATGIRTMLAAPLLFDGAAIGAIAIRRTKVRPFTSKQIALLEAFAEHAATAIEKTRLAHVLTVALDRQTATSEILRVIGSSPTDAQPVFDAVARSAVRLLGGFSGAVLRLVGDDVHLVAITSTSDVGDEAMRARYPRPLADTPLSAQVVREGAPCIVSDTEADLLADNAMRQVARARGFRSQLQVPMLRQGTTIGLIGVTRREPGPFAAEEIALLQTFADQAVIAIENVRLFRDLTEALEQQTATSEILRVISSSPTTLDPVLEAVVKTAARLCDANNASLYRVEGDLFRKVAGHGSVRTSREVGDTRPVTRGTVSGRVILERRTIHIPDLLAEVDTESPETKDNVQHEGVRTFVSTPLLREGVPIGVIAVYRTEVRPFSDKQIALLQTFADQAVIAIENVRLFKELEARNRDLNVTLDRQTATSEILRVIGSSPTDAQPVFDAIATSAMRLLGGFSGAVLRLVGDDVDLVAITSTSDLGDEAMRARYPRPLADTPLSAQAVRDRAPCIVSDTEADPRADDAMRQIARVRGFRSMLQVPMLHEDTTIGLISVTRREPGPFAAEEIALLQTFADQAVIAIENVRLFKELEARNSDLTEALEQQTATGEILRVISSSPTDIQPVLDTLVESAGRLCQVHDVSIFRVDGDVLRAAAHQGPIAQESVVGHVPVIRGTTGGRSVLDRQTIHLADLQAETDEFPEGSAFARRLGHRTILTVPLLREGKAIGVINLRRAEVLPFTDKQIKLLQTFADQAVIAIENVRLFTELQEKNHALTEAHAQVTEALEQQTATSEILRVISSSPTDVQPVFDAIAESAVRLCDGVFGGVFRYDGELLHSVAHYRFTPEALELIHRQYPMRPRGFHALALEQGAVIQSADVLTDPRSANPELARTLGYRSFVGVPMLRGDQRIGVIGVYGTEARPFTDKQVQLLQTFADQAVIAIENVRLFTELQASNRDLTRALDQQTATAEILRVISTSPTNVQPVFDAIVESAVRLCEARFGAVFRLDGGLVHLAAHHNFSETQLALLQAKYPMTPNRGHISGRAILTGAALQIPDIIADEEYRSAEAKEAGFRSLLGVPMVRGGRAIGAIVIYRTEPGQFADTQIELLKTFADQAVIAIENVRLFTELQARNRDLTESLERETATGEILRVISSSPTDIQPVLAAILDSGRRLCDAEFGAIFRFEGGAFVNAASTTVTSEFGAWLQKTPIQPGPGTPLRRVGIERRPVQVADILSDPDFAPPDTYRREGMRTALAVPMLKDGALLGALTFHRRIVKPFAEQQIALLQTFAAQAVIAIENVRLFKELEARNRDLTEALEQQTATSEILGVISASPTDEQPVFDTIVNRAGRLCNAETAVLYRFEGEVADFAAHYNLDTAALQAYRNSFPCPLVETDHLKRVMDGSVLNIEDIDNDPHTSDKSRGDYRSRGARSTIIVPMLREGRAIGAISVTHRDLAAFSDKRVQLLKTFADQAVIAIENVRLFKELQARNRDLTEALEQQTATAEILRVISTSPTNLQPVLDTVVASAARFCGAYDVTLFQVDGDSLRFPAHYGPIPVPADPSIPLVRGHVTGRAVLERRVVHLADAQAETEAFPNAAAHAKAQGHRTILGVPLLREGAAIGALLLRRTEVDPFTDKQVTLLQTFADQAVIAIENVRLFKELQARTAELTRSVEQLTALGEVGRAVSSTLDVETVLDTIVSRARQLASADGCMIYEYDEATEQFHVRATHNLDAEFAETIRGVPFRKGEGVMGRAAEMREPFQIADVTEPGAYESSLRDVIIRAGYRAALSVPLLREDQVIGSLSLTRKTPGEFAPEVVELLKTFATQSALAIQNARLFKEIEDKGRQLEVASRHKSQFLANMSHELRTPLNAILGYTELLQDGIYGQIPEKAQETMQRVGRSGRHLLALINDVLDLSKIEAGQLTLSLGDYSLKEVVQTVVTAMEPLAAEKKLALSVTLAPDLPVGRGDDRRLSQVLLNLVGNAVKFTDAGEVRVAARVSDAAFVVTVSDTGPGIAPEDQQRIFEEFQQADTSNTRKKGGTGLGLSIARRILALHGGRIWVESAPSKGSTFSFTVPVRVEGMAEVP